jgi:hypothetical protein
MSLFPPLSFKMFVKKTYDPFSILGIFSCMSVRPCLNYLKNQYGKLAYSTSLLAQPRNVKTTVG